MKNKIKIYTDGSARGNPGPAGYGIVIIKDNKTKELGGRANHATNNQMEIKACIKALEYLKKNKINDDIEIYSDSKYVINGIESWIENWKKNGWRTAGRKDVLNKELWQDLDKLNKEYKIKWNYVEGHSGDIYNDRADEIATSYALNIDIDLLDF